MKSHFRVVNKLDLVPKIPPTFFTFRHMSRELYFRENATSYIFCKSNEDPKCSAEYPIYQFSIHDHLTYLGVDVRSGKPYGC